MPTVTGGTTLGHLGEWTGGRCTRRFSARTGPTCPRSCAGCTRKAAREARSRSNAAAPGRRGWLAQLLGFPSRRRECRDASLSSSVAAKSRSGRGRFGEHTMVSRQRLRARRACSPSASARSSAGSDCVRPPRGIDYDLVGAALVLGGLRLPLPRCLSPRGRRHDLGGGGCDGSRRRRSAPAPRPDPSLPRPREARGRRGSGVITALCLLAAQGAFGAFDTLYYHEWRARLPAGGAQTRPELLLHAVRDMVYALLFGLLPALPRAGRLGRASRGARRLRDRDHPRRLPGGGHACARPSAARSPASAPPTRSWRSSTAPSSEAGRPASCGTGARPRAGSRSRRRAVLVAVMTLMSIGVFASGLRDFYAAFGGEGGGWPWTKA